MRRSILAAAVAALTVVPATAEADVYTYGKRAHITDNNACSEMYTVKEYAYYASRVYRRAKISQAAQNRMARMHKCQPTYLQRKAVGKRHERYKAQRQQRKLVASYTPFGRWAIPAYIVMCESGGNFRARNPVSTAGGAYQIIDSTWYGHGGSRYNDSHPAAVAPPWEQHKIAARIWRSGGPSQWECA